ncbi:MAG TPA: AraC family transcriptional regulator [Thermoanaerobaculia bacterium]|nr:AraC family transcriptional regulator [Thermoanaerobaculia bacterium]
MTQLHFTSVPELDLELLHASNVTHVYPPHLHEVPAVTIVLDGIEITRIGEREYVATAGDVILINADEVHASRSVNAEYIAIKVHRDLAFAETLVRDPRLFAALLRFTQTFDPRDFELVPTITAHDELRAVAAVRSYLKAHFAEEIALAELSAIAGLSPFHLLRVFRKHTGLPPHEYQLQLRIAHARKLIRDGARLSDAALETGFCDQSHLSRSFKRIVGITPGQYSAASKIVQDRDARD